MTSKDYETRRCSNCRTPLYEDPKPGTPCPAGHCDSYLVLVPAKSSKYKLPYQNPSGYRLRWHHPLTCEEWEPEYQPCLEGGGPCAIYVKVEVRA